MRPHKCGMAINPLFLDIFCMRFENKVTGSPGNNYLITSVLDQNSITIIEGVSDSHTVVCWGSLRSLMLMGCCYVLSANSKQKKRISVFHIASLHMHFI